MKLVLRRAEPTDAVHIQAITHEKDGKINSTFTKRYGQGIDIASLIELSPLSLVATDATESKIIGFCSFTNGTPDEIKIPDSHSSAHWDIWLRGQYEVKDVTVHNTKFLAFFAAELEHQIAFLDAALATVFSMLPYVKQVCYMLPELLSLFPPLSSSKYQPPEDAALKKGGSMYKRPSKMRSLMLKRRGRYQGLDAYFSPVQAINPEATFALQLCHRKNVFPLLKVRRARVEDCDDLVPMFQKQNLLQGKKADHYLAQLVESPDESTKTLVAEVDGAVVGFMGLSANVDFNVLTANYDLTLFDNLCKDIPEELIAIAAGENQIPQSKSNSVTDDMVFDDSDQAEKQGPALSQKEAIAAIEAIKNIQNSFCINLLCIEDSYSNQTSEFIKAAFQLYPDREFCIVTLPTTAPEIPLLRNFVMINPKPGKSSMHCMYLINRFGVSEVLNVRLGLESDLQSVEQFVKDSPATPEILARVKKAVKTPAEIPGFKLFIAEASGQCMGIIVLEQCLNGAVLADQFNVEEFINLNVTKLENQFILLRHTIINPYFSHQSKWFLEEAMRQANVSCLMYPVDANSTNDSLTRIAMAAELAPVRRRRQILFKNNQRDGINVLPPLEFNLQLTTVSMLYEPRIRVNTRVVVLGGSDTGLSFLERLIYNPHIHFTNLTLVTSTGITGLSCHEDNLNYSSINLKQLGIDHYVTVLNDYAVEFDRVLKRLQLQSGSFIMYDYLILTPGVQYFAASISEEFASLKGVVNSSPRSMEEVDRILSKRQTSGLDLKGSVVVYGRTIDAYSRIEQLLTKIEPALITLVLTPLKQPTGCFDNSEIEKKVHNQLIELGVNILNNHAIVDWESTDGALSKVTLKSKGKADVGIENIMLFVYVDELTAEPTTFGAINDSCLVFDGRLVIDRGFKTQDPFIYAAGTITKYSSRYETKWSHCFYDSTEVGAKLAETVLPLFDPTILPTETDESSLIKFTEAKKLTARLPGNYIYFHFDEPRLPSHTLDFRRSKPEYGRDFIIDKPELGYFRIHIDTFGFVRSITYFGKRTIPSQNYLSLYGVHEQHLNNLVSRFDEGIIPDFVSFFEEDWAYPIFHDRFISFNKQSRGMLLSSQDPKVANIVTNLQDLIVTGYKVDEDEKAEMFKKFQTSRDKKLLDDQIFEFYLSTKVCETYP